MSQSSQSDPEDTPSSKPMDSKVKSFGSNNKLSTWNFLLTDWNDYFTSPKPHTIDQSSTHHQMIINLYNYKNLKFFNEVLTFQTLSIGIQAILDYQKAVSIEGTTDQELIFKELMQRLEFHPDNILGSLALAIHHQNEKKPKIFIGVKNFPILSIREIKPHMVRTMMTIKGVVLKVGAIKLLPTSINFKCTECKHSSIHYLIDGVYDIPEKCTSCKSRVIVPDKTSIKSIRNQRIKIQQSDSNNLCLEVEMRENLVGKIIAGDSVSICGILKAENDQKDKKTQGILSLALHANFIVNERSYVMSQQAEAAIRKMRNDPYIFTSLIKSFCPTIFGNQLVKAGLLLGLVGGTSQTMSKGSGFRQNSHILMLGDPGLGKSQLLKFATQLLPNSVYVSGSVITQSGLTVAVNKDGGESSIEAGALVLCDKGICGIDQFDKISDSSALLEAMQQQTVSIAKAGIICQLQSRVTIIASANPIHGNYMKGKSLKDNIKISNAILSRFDLIFLLLDKPDPDRDQKLSSHIMKIHNKTKVSYSQMFDNPKYQQFHSLAAKYQRLIGNSSTYTQQELKHYLEFVRNQIHPQLSPQAAEILKCFYLTLRSENMSSSVPITTRQLQSLIRLSMAKARLECKTQITKSDAEEIIQLMQQSLFDALEDLSLGDNNPFKNNGKKNNFKPMGEQSLPKQTKAFVNRLSELAETKQEPIWDFRELMVIGKQLGMAVGDFDLFIERLNESNTLILRPGRKFELKIRKL